MTFIPKKSKILTKKKVNTRNNFTEIIRTSKLETIKHTFLFNNKPKFIV